MGAGLIARGWFIASSAAVGMSIVSCSMDDSIGGDGRLNSFPELHFGRFDNPRPPSTY